MAARTKKLRHDEETRKKIQVTQLINRLMGHINDKVELRPTQVRSIEILLNKSLPNLSDVKIEHNVDGVTFNLNMGAPKK
jgi:hypothetical protein